MSKPNVVRNNTQEQWRVLVNRISDNLGDPVDVYTSDAPDNVSVVYPNATDTYTHPADELDALKAAINNLNLKKVKRSGDTISGSLNVQTSFSVDTNTTLGNGADRTLTINGTAVSIPNNLNFDSNTLFIDSTANKVAVGSAVATETLDVTGTFGVSGTMYAKAVTASTNPTTGSLVVSGGVGIAGNVFTNGNLTTAGDVTVSGGDLFVIGATATIQNTTGASTADIFNANVTTLNLAGAATTANIVTSASALSIGAATGTATINNATVTLSNAAQVNFNGVSPTIASTSTGTLTLFNTNLVTVNAFGAATAVTIGATTGTATVRNAAVVLGQTGSGTTTINSPTVNISTGVSGITTVVSSLEATAANSAALIVTGGAWIAKKEYVGTSVTTPIHYGQVATAGAVVIRANETDLTTGYVSFPDSLEATNNTTGAARFLGGISVAKKLYAVGDLTVGSNFVVTATTGLTTINGAGGLTVGTGPTAITGTLTVNGSNTNVVISPTGTSTVAISPAAGVTINPAAGGLTVGATSTASFTNVTDNSLGTAASGAVQLSGGLGVAKNITSGASIYATTSLGVAAAPGSYVANIAGATQITGALTIAGASNSIKMAQGNDTTVLTDTGVSTSTLATVAQTPVLSFAAATYSSAEISVQAYDATSGTRQFSKLLLTYNGTDTSITEYGTVIAGTAQIATYATDLNTGNIRLLVTGKSTNSTVYKIQYVRFTT